MLRGEQWFGLFGVGSNTYRGSDLGRGSVDSGRSLDAIERMPVRVATMTFTFSGSESTVVGVRYDYTPKGGPLALLLGPLLDRRWRPCARG